MASLRDGLSPNIITGSVYGALVQAGSHYAATSAGSATIAFETAYGGLPIVVASIGSYSASAITGAVGAGSAWVAVNKIATTGCELVCGLGSGGTGFADAPLLNWVAVGI